MCEPELGMSEILLADTRRPTHNAKIVSKKTCKTMDDTKLHVYVLQAVEKRPIPVVGTSAVGTSAIPKTTPQSTTTNTSLDSDSDEDDSKPEQVKRPRLGEILVTYFKARQAAREQTQAAREQVTAAREEIEAVKREANERIDNAQREINEKAEKCINVSKEEVRAMETSLSNFRKRMLDEMLDDTTATLQQVRESLVANSVGPHAKRPKQAEIKEALIEN